MQEPSTGTKAVGIALLFAGLGTLFKLLGGVLYGSKAVLIDGATCIGNLVAGVALYNSIIKASGPPDRDHPFGHSRLIYKGVLLVQVIYAFIAGFSAAILYYSYYSSYEVEAGAPAYAIIGTAFYSVAIISSRRQGYAGSVYSGFTFSEVIEGIVTATASFAAFKYGKLYDIIGGVIILSYLIYELVEESNRLGLLVSDYVEPKVAANVKELLEERGFKVIELRVRTIVPGHYQGDAVVRADYPYDVADLLIDDAVEEARRALNVDLVVHIDTPKQSQSMKRESQ